MSGPMQPPAMPVLMRCMARRAQRKATRGTKRRSDGVDGVDGQSDVYAVPRAVGVRLLERLHYLKLTPARVVEIGATDPALSAGLQQRFPAADVIAFSVVAAERPARRAGWWARRRARSPGVRRLQANPYQLPLADASVDLVVSNLFIPWCDAPVRLFDEVARILSPGGALLCSTAGPHTLREYRALWTAVDAHEHVFGLLDMHDLGDAMVQSGLSDPVVDREDLTIDYPSVAALEAELQALGGGNLARARRPGLMAASVTGRLQQLAGDGRFGCTLEVVQGNAWKSEAAQIQRSDVDEYRVSLASLRQSLKG